MEENKEIISCICGKKFIAYKSQKRKYCSLICRNLYIKGNNQYTNNRRSMKKNCLFCKKIFITTLSKNKKYCSAQCYYKALYASTSFPFNKRADLTKQIIKSCLYCKKIFKSYVCCNRKFCSNMCFRLYYKSVKKQKSQTVKSTIKYITTSCKYCHKQFEDLISRHRKFCSRTCKNKWQSENFRNKNNPNWKSDKIKVSFKGTVDWNEWRKKVFERDKYTCQYCGRVRCYLEPHHLKSKQCFPELVYEVLNGITLCKLCHRKLHKLRPANNKIKIQEYPLSILQNKF